MRRVLQVVSALGTFFVLFCVLFFAQNYTLGLIPAIRNTIVFHHFYLGELIFTGTSIMIILIFFRISAPKRSF